MSDANILVVTEWQQRLFRAEAEAYRSGWWWGWRLRRRLSPMAAFDLALYFNAKAVIEHRLWVQTPAGDRVWYRYGRYREFQSWTEWLLPRAERYRSRRIFVETFLSNSVAANALGLVRALEQEEAVVVRVLYHRMFRRLFPLPRWWRVRTVASNQYVSGRRAALVEVSGDVRRAMQDIWHQEGAGSRVSDGVVTAAI